jgi:hypothetical protein
VSATAIQQQERLCFGQARGDVGVGCEHQQGLFDFEGYTFIFKVNAFNTLNHAVWNNNYQATNDINFGGLLKGPTAQGNNPRQIQLSATLRF